MPFEHARPKRSKDLITSSVQKIQGGSALAADAGLTMAEVTQAVSRVTDIMAEIAAASQEQSRGIEQVNVAITQMDEVTQQNAALVEEAAAASQSLEHQGKNLNQAVAFFRLGEMAFAHSSPHVAPAVIETKAPHGRANQRAATNALSTQPKLRAVSTASDSTAWETF